MAKTFSTFRMFHLGWRNLLIIVPIVVVIIVGMLSAFGLSYGAWISAQINIQFEQLRGKRPSQIYAVLPAFSIGNEYRAGEIERILKDYGYQRDVGADELCSSCFRMFGSELLLRRPESTIRGLILKDETFRIIWEQNGPIVTVRQMTSTQNGVEVSRLEHRPLRVGIFSAGRLRTQDFVPISEIPVYLRLAVMGIEDSQFLEHNGVSVRAILRALWRDLAARRFAQGGSTITQQLMKNLFFSRDKVITRKFKEAFYALVAESKHSKEEILEAYLNEVYLGQWSSHEIHGVNEGARFYFNKAATELSLSQSATLAALIQAPNIHDPQRYAERLRVRRDLVLKRMVESDFIVEEEYLAALREPLAVTNAEAVIEGIDYYLELAFAEMPEALRSRLDTGALTVLLPMNSQLQQGAALSISTHLKQLEDRIVKMRPRNPPQVSLEGALIAINVASCQVIATQGGRSYRLSPFNRILQGRRQLGSLAKPFVFLTGLLAQPPITPDSVLSDTPFEWEYDRQVWKPKNFENEFRGDVTARQALELSLNVPTARLAQQLGISSIIQTMRAAGIKSDFMAVPSVSLGGEELSPLELANSFLTLARQGRTCRLTSLSQVFDENGNELYRSEPSETEVFDKGAVTTLLDMMRGVLIRGTAKAASQVLGDEVNYFVGKTGTTSEFRDAWFVGFSPDILVLVWVGYDEKELVGLTGASAALPLWEKVIQLAKPYYLPRGF